MLISDIVEKQVRESPDSLAIDCDGRRYSFGEFGGRVSRLASATANAAAQGERVVILAENCIEYVESYYAVPRAGRILTLLNYRLAEIEVAKLIANARPTVLLVARTYLPKVAATLADSSSSITTLVVIGWQPGDPGLDYEVFLASGSANPLPRPSADDPAWLLFTSGTTGTPKGALLTHRNVLAGVTNSLLSWGLRGRGSLLIPWPLYHVAGYAILAGHVNGDAVYLMKRFDTAAFLRTISEHSVTDVSLAPTMLNMLLEAPDSRDYDLSSLERVYYGSAAMPVDVLRAAMERLPAARFRTGFGMTELSGLALYLSDEDHNAAAAGRTELLTSVGRPMPYAQVRLVNEAFEDVAPGEVGEIAVSGDQVVSSYWQGTDHPTGVIRDGWLRTGDLGRFDNSGYLYVVDRLKDMIITGGENVFSLEVEAALHSHPAVSMAAVFGVPDTHWGEIVLAAVRRVPDTNVLEDELIAFCRTRLAGYKRPRRIIFVDELPMNPSGKILKHRLRDLVSESEQKAQ